jgi:hypothetical protein
MIFVSWRDGNVENYAMEAGGGTLTRLTANPAFDLEPDWQTVSVRPRNKEDRKADSRRRFTAPPFENQGPCIKSVNDR